MFDRYIWAIMIGMPAIIGLLVYAAGPLDKALYAAALQGILFGGFFGGIALRRWLCRLHGRHIARRIRREGGVKRRKVAS